MVLSTAKSNARRGVALAAILGLVVAAFFAMRTPASAADASVSISGLAYNPASVTINVGDSVTWTNNDVGVQHTVNSDSGSQINSGVLNSGQSYAQEFTAAGTYTYHCNIHSTMSGTVIVQQVAETPTTTTATNTPTITTTATTTAATNTPTNTATPTPTQTATLTPTAMATATRTNTAIPTATGTSAVSPASPTPGAPNTGEGAGGGAGSNTGVIALALGVMAILGATGTAFAVRGTSRR